MDIKPKEQFWRKHLGRPIGLDFISYIDQQYPLMWNKDLSQETCARFGIAVSPAQLRAYAKKFGLTKTIDERQKACLLLRRKNPNAAWQTLNDALTFLHHNGQHLTNKELAAYLDQNFKLQVTEWQVADILNAKFGIKKTAETIARGRDQTISALKKYYQVKHDAFTSALSRCPQAMTVIIASLLGDAELSPVQRGFAVFRDHHSALQYDWLKFKASFLPPEPYFRFITYRDGSVALVSQSHPLFDELQACFYLTTPKSSGHTLQQNKREKTLGPRAAAMVEAAFTANPALALAILIGDDGALCAFTRGATVNYEYIIFSQGFSEKSGLTLKHIIEKTTGLNLSVTRASGEYGVRLTISGIAQIKAVSQMIGQYLARVATDAFRKKYDLEWHCQRLADKHGQKLAIASPVAHWSEPELAILQQCLHQGLTPATTHRALTTAGFSRTYFATYAKCRELINSDQTLKQS